MPAENQWVGEVSAYRMSSADTSQRMLNALLPGTVVPIHRHLQSTENVFLLCGKIVEVICDEMETR